MCSSTRRRGAALVDGRFGSALAETGVCEVDIADSTSLTVTVRTV